MKYLIVAAHPDDEVLGAGALIHNAVGKGDEVYVCLLSQWSPTRTDDLKDGIKTSHKMLGVTKSYIEDFECMKFKDMNHHEMVIFIENCIKDCWPDVVITHHPADIHIDHGVTSECCMEAAKLPLRQIVDIPPIKKIMFMEVPSSTDWNINVANPIFTPNIFYGVDYKDVIAKIEAIGVYKNVIRKAPHPRSATNINALTIVRGGQCGQKYAEAFQLAFGLEV